MIRPHGAKVTARRIEPSAKTKGGIYMPEDSLERTQLAEVLAVGTGVKGDIKVGNVVAIGQYTGYDVKVRGEEFVMLLEKDILAVVSAKGD